MGKPILMPTGDDNFVVAYTAAADDFNFGDELARSRRQEAAKDFEGACNTRLHAFQRLVELIPDDTNVTLDWEDENSQEAIVTGYYSGIDHFLLGDWEMAAAIFEAILDLDPEDHLEATTPLAYTYVAMEELDSFDEIINDVNDKHVDKVVLTLWSEFRRTGKLPEGELFRFRTKFAPYHAEFTAAQHPADEQYLAAINADRPSTQALARELWFRTEHLWALTPEFIEVLEVV